jgi:hypothetical protein
MIHEGRTDHVVPSAREKPEYKDYIFGYTQNHWADFDETKKFTSFCYKNFLRKWMEKYKVDFETAKREAKGIWMFDCWPVHCRADFRDWVSVECPGFELMCVRTSTARCARTLNTPTPS